MGASYSQQIFLEPKGDIEPVDFGRAGESASGEVPLQARRPRRDSTWQLRQRIASTFAMVAEFRFQHAAGDSNSQLASMLRNILVATRSTFNVAARLRPPNQRVAADRARCIADLAQLLDLLMVGARPPMHELSHAMDAAIVHLVQLMQVQVQAQTRGALATDVYAGPMGGIDEPTDSTHVDFDVSALPRC